MSNAELNNLMMAAQRERRLKNVLLAIRQINRLIITERNPEVLLQSACNALAGLDSHYSALIVLFDQDARVKKSACAGVDRAYDHLRERMQQGYTPDCVTQALARKTIHQMQNMDHCARCPLAQSCMEHVALTGRLEWDDHIYGVMTVSVDKSLASDPEEQSLFHDLLSDIAFALHKIETEEQYRKNHLALRESEERFAMLARYSPQIIYLCRNDAAYSMLFVNDAVEEVTGFSKENFLSNGKGYAEMVHPDDLPECVHIINESVAETKRFELSYRIIRKDGTIRWVEEHGGVIRTDDGEVLLVGTITDATNRKQVEIERERLSMAIEQLAETVVITDSNGVIQYVNKGFEQSSGFSRDEAIGQKPSMLKSGEQDEAFYQDLWDTITRGEIWTGILHNLRKDGTAYEEEAIISPVHDLSGRISNYVAVKRDITLERSLQKQLLQSQKMEAVGQMAGGIAHDFNNLLTVIMSAAGFLQASLPVSSDAQGEAEEIIDAATRAAELTRQLLSFSRRQIMVPAPADLNEIVSGMQRMLRRLMPEDIAIEFAYAEQAVPVCVDKGQVEQVVMNLVLNARGATKRGGEIEVHTECCAPTQKERDTCVEPPDQWDDEMAVIRVVDNGSGMNKKTIARIFEPFFTTKEIGEGTGLGLSTVLRIVRQHGGTVSVSSKSMEGSTFRVYLPLSKPGEGGQAASGPTALVGGAETLLFVEDDPDVRVIVSRLLGGLGYQVLTASTGSEALTISRNYEGTIHGLVTDLVMPGMSGEELGERILHTRPRIKILYATGYPEAHLTQIGIDITGHRLIRKPFNRTELARTIRELMEQYT